MKNLKLTILTITLLIYIPSVFTIDMDVDEQTEQTKKEILNKLESGGLYTDLSNIILDYVGSIEDLILNAMLLDAARNLDTKLIYKAVKLGADVNAKDAKNYTAYDYIEKAYKKLYGNGSHINPNDIDALTEYSNLMPFLKPKKPVEYESIWY